jgi:hypothetical protein
MWEAADGAIRRDLEKVRFLSRFGPAARDLPGLRGLASTLSDETGAGVEQWHVRHSNVPGVGGLRRVWRAGQTAGRLYVVRRDGPPLAAARDPVPDKPTAPGGSIDGRRRLLQRDPIPGRIRLVAHTTHHEVVIRWDSQTTDETANLTSDAKLTEAWRKIVAQHVDVPSMAPMFEVTARSWSD